MDLTRTAFGDLWNDCYVSTTTTAILQSIIDKVCYRAESDEFIDGMCESLAVALRAYDDCFDYTGHRVKAAVVEAFIGK